jgi:hypothetical protein
VEAFLNMKTELNRIDEWVSEAFPENGFMIPDGLEDAFIGVAVQFNKHIAIFDYDKCLTILMKDGMTYHEAEEYMEFNVTGAYVGENTPAFLFKYKNYETSRNSNDQ